MVDDGDERLFMEAFRTTPTRPWEVLFAVATLVQGAQIDLCGSPLTVGLAARLHGVMTRGLAWAPITAIAVLWFAAVATGWFTSELCGRRHPPVLPRAVGPPGREPDPPGTPGRSDQTMESSRREPPGRGAGGRHGRRRPWRGRGGGRTWPES